MEYKYELHCHTGHVSRCADASAKEIAGLYKSRGYSGIVVTDHYSPLTFLGGFSSDNDYFLEGYRKLLEYADDDFTVLLGMELRYYFTPNDYLVYGVTPDFLETHGNLMTYFPRRFYKEAVKNNMVVVQAHPFRPYIFRTRPKYLDGCEVNNTKDSGKGSINEKALEWAEKKSFPIRTGGTDFHHLSQSGNLGGIITDTKIKTNDDLLSVLRNGAFRIIDNKPGETI